MTEESNVQPEGAMLETLDIKNHLWSMPFIQLC